MWIWDQELGIYSIEMNRWAIRKNIKVDLIGIENNPFIVDFSKKYTKHYDNITIENNDLFSFASSSVPPSGSSNISNSFILPPISPQVSSLKAVDIVCLNNVLHHLNDEEILKLFQSLILKTNLAIIINDLRREIIPYYAIKWLTKLMNMSMLAQHDGPLSVLKSFQEQDFNRYFSLLHSNNLNINNIKRVEIHKSWAFRWQVIIYLK